MSRVGGACVQGMKDLFPEPGEGSTSDRILPARNRGPYPSHLVLPIMG